MSDHRYLDVFLKEEDRLAKEVFRSFVEKEIMPVRQKIDGDGEHQGGAQVGRFDVCRSYYDCNL